MAETSESGGVIQYAGEGVWGVISSIPPAIGDFFTGVGRGAGADRFFDWTAVLIGMVILISVVTGLKRGRIAGPVVSGLIGVTLLGWAVA